MVDDCCPELTGDLVTRADVDPRVKVIRHMTNTGVGGAMISGYSRALEDGADIIVKLDGDGQMDPRLIDLLTWPIIDGSADYTKGNRFFDLSKLSPMPSSRIFGNCILSVLAKVSTGYWTNLDPNNGFTAIHADVLRYIPLEKISRSYFFESDMLFRLNILRAVVLDVPMNPIYGLEKSNLKIRNIWLEFLLKHFRNLYKRIFYNYFLRDISGASLQLIAGLGFTCFGLVFGAYNWQLSLESGVVAASGTVSLASLSVILGAQFLLAFLAFDIACVPKTPINKLLVRYSKIKSGANPQQ